MLPEVALLRDCTDLPGYIMDPWETLLYGEARKKGTKEAVLGNNNKLYLGILFRRLRVTKRVTTKKTHRSQNGC